MNGERTTEINGEVLHTPCIEGQQRLPSRNFKRGMAVLAAFGLSLGTTSIAEAEGQDATPNEELNTESFDDEVSPVPAGSLSKVYLSQPNKTAVVSIIATETKGAGYLQAKQASDNIGAFSSLNADRPNQTVAGLAFVSTDATGSFELYNQPETHLVVDEQGFFNQGAVDDIPDVRLLDTRLTSNKPLPAGSFVRLKGRPNSTGVVSIIADQVASKGYFQILPSCDAPVGGSSNLNVDEIGQTRNSLAFVPFDENGEACGYAQASAHWIADLQAYMSPLAFNDIDDMRLVDTRENATKPAQGAKIEINGTPDATGVVSIVSTEAVGPSYVQVMSEGDIEGASSNLNVNKAGDTIATLSFVRFDKNGKAHIYVQRSMHVIADLQGYFLNGSFDNTPDRRVLDTRNGFEGSGIESVTKKVGKYALNFENFKISCEVERSDMNGSMLFLNFSLNGLNNRQEVETENDFVSIEGDFFLSNGLYLPLYLTSFASSEGELEFGRGISINDLDITTSYRSDNFNVRIDHPDGTYSSTSFRLSGVCATIDLA
jgi:hypothetical protein